MSDAGVERGGFGQQGAVGPHMPQQVDGSEAAILFIGHTGEHDITGQPRAFGGQRADGGHRGGDPALHVVGAAAVHATVANLGGERVGHPFDADGVDVARQHQAATAARSGQAGNRRHPTGFRFEEPCLQAQGVELGGDEARHRTFAGAGCRQCRIDTFDAHQARQQLTDVIAVNGHDCL